MTFIVKNGGYYIHYSDIKTDNQFLAPDGVHLNELGNNILLNIIQGAMDQFRNDVALWVNKLRGRYDAIFIEPENVSKIS
jgi:hypothetical protein